MFYQSVKGDFDFENKESDRVLHLCSRFNHQLMNFHEHPQIFISQFTISKLLYRIQSLHCFSLTQRSNSVTYSTDGLRSRSKHSAFTQSHFHFQVPSDKSRCLHLHGTVHTRHKRQLQAHSQQQILSMLHNATAQIRRY